MIQPVNLQLAHFNVEHSAQISKDALAAAQQTGQGQEVVQESVKRAQVVQAGAAAAEPQKVKRREEEDQRERRREDRRGSFATSSDPEEDAPKHSGTRTRNLNLDLYA
jgi:hypothetical protein